MGIRCIELLPAAVPEWEHNCPCTFTTYIVRFEDQPPYAISYQRTYEFNDYQLLAAYLSAHRTTINGSALCVALAVTERD
jgi:hypothetical protein